jgi:arsenate reductase (glutaredoxin)
VPASKTRPGVARCAAMGANEVFQYPKCSTCRKALKWLDEHGVTYQKTDLVADPPSLSRLKDLHRRSRLPVARFFNTSGESYRAGNFKQKLATMNDTQALAALAADGKLIKRPIVDTGDAVLVGFDEKVYAAQLKRGRR